MGKYDVNEKKKKAKEEICLVTIDRTYRDVNESCVNGFEWLNAVCENVLTFE